MVVEKRTMGRSWGIGSRREDWNRAGERRSLSAFETVDIARESLWDNAAVDSEGTSVGGVVVEEMEAGKVARWRLRAGSSENVWDVCRNLLARSFNFTRPRKPPFSTKFIYFSPSGNAP